MAYVASDPQAQLQPQAQPGAGAPVPSGGAGVAGAKAKPAAQTAPAVPGQNVPATPSSELAAYIQANQNQAQNFGQQIAQSVGQQVNAAGQAIAPATQAYGAGLTNTADNPTLDAQVATSPASLTAAQQQAYEQEIGAAGAAPQSNATFETTPAYANLAANIQQAVEQANLWGAGNNPADLSTAIAPFEGAGTTQGNENLDALLISQTPGAYNAITAATAPAAGLQGQLAAASQGADQGLLSAIGNDQAATAAANAAAQEYATNLTAYLAQAVQGQQAANAGTVSTDAGITQAVGSGQLTTQQAADLGIPAAQIPAFIAALNGLNPGVTAENALIPNLLSPYITNDTNPTMRDLPTVTPLPTMNLSNYLQPAAPPPVATDANVANAQNYADVAALDQMLGPSSAITLPISSATANQAGLGTLAPNYETFSAPALRQALAGEQGAIAGLGAQENYLVNAANTIGQTNEEQNAGQPGGPALPVAAQSQANAQQLQAYIQAILSGIGS